jgi:uncharacterized protein YjiS (DUF1127 family)
VTYLAENASPAVKFEIAAAGRTAVESVFAGIAQWRRVHQTVQMLSALDDTALRDIGLDRSQIMLAARRAATEAAHRIQR